MPDLYLELLKIGGPLFALAALVVYLSHLREMKTLNLFSNHLNHTNQGLERNNGLLRALTLSVDRLVDRIDKLFLGSNSSS